MNIGKFIQAVAVRRIYQGQMVSVGGDVVTVQTRCHRRMLRRKMIVLTLRKELEDKRELEDIYWEQTKKLTGEVKAEFKKYARRYTKERKQIEKALRSRGVSL